VLQTLGSGTIRVGEPGAAQRAKLINNMLAGVNSVAIAEGLALARAAGLSYEAALEVVNAGTGASFMSTNREALLEMGRQSDLAGLGYKDLLLALQEAHSWEISLPVTAIATQFLADYHKNQPTQ
jgi:3-hydroxyisobutyrate dehydrogenase